MVKSEVPDNVTPALPMAKGIFGMQEASLRYLSRQSRPTSARNGVFLHKFIGVPCISDIKLCGDRQSKAEFSLKLKIQGV
jgi:hypothetical protein